MTDPPDSNSFKKKEAKRPETQILESEDTRASLTVVPIQTIRMIIAALVNE